MVDGKKSKNRSRGIYLLPNLFTAAALFSGFYAIIAAMGQRFEAAAVAVFIAMILDGLDGRVARLTHTQSAFGAEFDSLSDMVSFGVAPAILVFTWSLSDLGKVGWLAAFVYAATTALRLARFNTQVGTADKRFFQGLPSPAAAGVVAGMVWLGADMQLGGPALAPPVWVVTVLTGILMVSNVRFNSFKELDLRGRVPFMAILIIMLIFVTISLHPPAVLFGGFLVYTISGVVLTLLQIRKHRLERRRGKV